MSFFAKDYASYFKLAELLSLVDLSLVRGRDQKWPGDAYCGLLCISAATAADLAVPGATGAATAAATATMLLLTHLARAALTTLPCRNVAADHQAGSAVQPVGR